MPTETPAHSKPVKPRAPLVRILGPALASPSFSAVRWALGSYASPGRLPGNWRASGSSWRFGGAGALYTLLGAISLSELGTAMSQAGGCYVYGRRAFGPGAGFATGWADWLNNCAAVAYGAVTAAEYLEALFAGLSEVADGEEGRTQA